MPRCAIYTRKSTEEGLEQDFNSLDAQREACESYINSQRHEGWRIIRSHFDDGGSSGGTMNRPALIRLLDAVKRREVDIVVVYKVDRLTRALADFAKIVELFDAYGVSFVSVTQQFNTTSSMGRLTLNVLLSFAQFEREVTAERIRDKIAASKKKGMWMGGLPPLGYDVKDRKLVTNDGEAKIVRKLFQLYIEVGSVRRLKEEADRLGLSTKRRLQNGTEAGGKSFTRGNLYQLLSNPLYIGRIAHKGENYPGLHDGIITQETWEAVQKRRADNSVSRNSSANVKSLSVLAGLVFDERGNRLGPSHTTKNGRRYRYYVSNASNSDTKGQSGWRLRAEDFERVVLDHLRAILKEPRHLIDELRAHLQLSASVLHTLREQASKLASALQNGHIAQQRLIIEAIVTRIDLSPSSVTLHLSRSGLLGTAADAKTAVKSDTVALVSPIDLRRRGVEQKLAIGTGAADTRTHDPKLCRLVAQAHLWFHQLTQGQFPSVREIARANKMPECDVSRTLRLAFLAPDIVAAIIEGRQPIDLTSETLRRLSALPADWGAQRRLLGFSA